VFVQSRLNRTVRRRIVVLAIALLVSAFGGTPHAMSAEEPAQTSLATAATPIRMTTRTEVARARATADATARSSSPTQRASDKPLFKKDMLGNLIPDVRAAAAIVFNPQTNEVLWEENSHDQRPIASLTKLMTAVTFLADEPDLNRKVKVVASDVRNASVTYLRSGESIALGDVLHLTLIASDNGAARVLARTAEGGTKAFLVRMNQMAMQLGLTSSHYADPSGLDARNVSSAYDLSHLIAFASQNEQLASVMRKTSYEVHTNRRTVKIKSTNRLLGTGVDVVAGKTGFIRKAGYCLATLIQIPHGSQVAVVVLGASSSTIRFAEARHLFNWVVGRTNGPVGGAALVER